MNAQLSGCSGCRVTGRCEGLICSGVVPPVGAGGLLLLGTRMVQRSGAKQELSPLLLKDSKVEVACGKQWRAGA